MVVMAQGPVAVVGAAAVAVAQEGPPTLDHLVTLLLDQRPPMSIAMAGVAAGTSVRKAGVAPALAEAPLCPLTKASQGLALAHPCPLPVHPGLHRLHQVQQLPPPLQAFAATCTVGGAQALVVVERVEAAAPVVATETAGREHKTLPPPMLMHIV